jgi:polysaccharide deacetylase family protein (PEP-CTERM system associated)
VTEARGAGDSRIVNAMTIDVEEYFQVSAFDAILPRSRWDAMESRVVANTERLLDIFEEHDVRATFFVLGWVAERFPGLVSAIASHGHEVASHGYGHQLVYDLSPTAFREDIRRSKAVIESAAGMPLRGYRAPSFSITSRSLWALDVLIEEGFAYDASIFPIHHDRYGIPGAPRFPHAVARTSGRIVEVPGSTARVGSVNVPVAGGGYFRMLPYRWTKWGIRRLNLRERQAAVFYLHPWEVDPGQPRLAAGRLSTLRHYRNLRLTEMRLRRLLSDFQFGTLQSVLDACPALAAPRVREYEGASSRWADDHPLRPLSETPPAKNPVVQ